MKIADDLADHACMSHDCNALFRMPSGEHAYGCDAAAAHLPIAFTAWPAELVVVLQEVRLPMFRVLALHFGYGHAIDAAAADSRNESSNSIGRSHGLDNARAVSAARCEALK